MSTVFIQNSDWEDEGEAQLADVSVVSVTAQLITINVDLGDSKTAQYLVAGAYAGVNGTDLTGLAGSITGIALAVDFGAGFVEQFSATDLGIDISTLDEESFTQIHDLLETALGRDDSTMDGSDDADTLIGGVGKDSLTGGAGRDIFDFNLATEMGNSRALADLILDFQHGIDDIDLSGIDANTGAAGNNVFTKLMFSGNFTAAGQLKYVGGVLYGNVDGDAQAEFAIQLSGAPTLSLGDLIL